METNNLTIKLDDFEGPLDLLLHLIRGSEVSIYDIPIVSITSQYMTYLNQMQANQLDVAGEYFVMAANLMKIKAKMLLPQKPEPDESNLEAEDPREELVNQLIEYKKYKNAATQLKQYELARHQQFTRPESEVPVGTSLVRLAPGLTSTDLKTALLSVLVKRDDVTITQRIHADQYTVEGQMKVVMSLLMNRQHPLYFENLFSHKPVVEEWVATFLSILELAKHRELSIDQKYQFASIKLQYQDGGNLVEEV